MGFLLQMAESGYNFTFFQNKCKFSNLIMFLWMLKIFIMDILDLIWILVKKVLKMMKFGLFAEIKRKLELEMS